MNRAEAIKPMTAEEMEAFRQQQQQQPANPNIKSRQELAQAAKAKGQKGDWCGTGKMCISLRATQFALIFLSGKNPK